MIYGAIQSARYRAEEDYIIIGFGMIATTVGALLSISSMSDKKKIIWVEKELLRRNGAKLSVGLNGVKLAF